MTPSTTWILLGVFISGIMMIGFTGIVATVATGNRQRLSGNARTHLELALGTAGSTCMMSGLVLLWLHLFPDPATGWVVSSAVFLFQLVAALIVHWVSSYRAGGSAPLILTVSILASVTILAFNIFVVNGSWPYLITLGNHFVLCIGSFVFLVYAIQGIDPS